MENEKRLIHANSLLEKIHDTAEGLADCDQQNAAWALRKYAIRDIMDAETVDAVEVVRCKECKRCFKHTTKRNKQNMWLCMRNEIEVCVRPDDFCSYGERKDGD